MFPTDPHRHRGWKLAGKVIGYKEASKYLRIGICPHIDNLYIGIDTAYQR